MDKNSIKRLGMVALVTSLAMGVTRCGGGEAKNKRTMESADAADATAPTPPPVEAAATTDATPKVATPKAAANEPAEVGPLPGERTFSEAELMTLVGLSTTQSQSAYGHCRDVLAQGIYDRYHETVSDTVKHALKERFCTMAEDEFAEKVETYYKEDRSGSHSSSHADSFGFTYMEYIGLEVATSGSGSDSSSQGITRAQALDTARKWKTSNCGDTSLSQSSDFEHTVLSEQIDAGVIDAWRSCVTKASNGFFCESSETEDTVSIHLRWDPNSVQATLLPKLLLREQTAHNLKLTSASVPDSLGTGSGISVTYQRLDPEKPSVFEAQGSDRFHQVDFNCSIQVSKVVRGQVKEAEVCGLKELKLGTGAACGVAHYNFASGPVCGVQTYNQLASDACGVLAYKVGPHPGCDGYVSHDVQTLSTSAPSCRDDAGDPDACPSGYLDRGVSNKTRTCIGRVSETDWTQVISRTRTCERAEFLASCQRPEFGVQAYNVCAHPSHGVYRYHQCQHASFGVASYQSCRHESFGRTFNSCFVPD